MHRTHIPVIIQTTSLHQTTYTSYYTNNKPASNINTSYYKATSLHQTSCTSYYTNNKPTSNIIIYQLLYKQQACIKHHIPVIIQATSLHQTSYTSYYTNNKPASNTYTSYYTNNKPASNNIYQLLYKQQAYIKQHNIPVIIQTTSLHQT